MRLVNGVMQSPINFTVGRQSLVVPTYINPLVSPTSTVLDKAVAARANPAVKYPSVWQKQEMATTRSLFHIKKHQQLKEMRIKKRVEQVAKNTANSPEMELEAVMRRMYL